MKNQERIISKVEARIEAIETRIGVINTEVKKHEGDSLIYQFSELAKQLSILREKQCLQEFLYLIQEKGFEQTYQDYIKHLINLITNHNSNNISTSPLANYEREAFMCGIKEAYILLA